MIFHKISLCSPYLLYFNIFIFFACLIYSPLLLFLYLSFSIFLLIFTLFLSYLTFHHLSLILANIPLFIYLFSLLFFSSIHLFVINIHSYHLYIIYTYLNPTFYIPKRSAGLRGRALLITTHVYLSIYLNIYIIGFYTFLHFKRRFLYGL